VKCASRHHSRPAESPPANTRQQAVGGLARRPWHTPRGVLTAPGSRDAGSRGDSPTRLHPQPPPEACRSRELEPAHQVEEQVRSLFVGFGGAGRTSRSFPTYRPDQVARQNPAFFECGKTAHVAIRVWPNPGLPGTHVGFSRRRIVNGVHDSRHEKLNGARRDDTRSSSATPRRSRPHPGARCSSRSADAHGSRCTKTRCGWPGCCGTRSRRSPGACRS
jgi:hypothetical protein